MAYDRLEPIGDHRGDWQAASICAMVANMAMVTHGATKRFRTKDFLLTFSDNEKSMPAMPAGQSWQEIKAISQMMVVAAAADEARKTKRGR